MIAYQDAYKELVNAVLEKRRPRILPLIEDVEVFAAAFCRLHSLYRRTNEEKENILDIICNFPEYPQCMMRVHYSLAVLAGANKVDLSDSIDLLKCIQDKMPDSILESSGIKDPSHH
jgi:hypothetical protein